MIADNNQKHLIFRMLRMFFILHMIVFVFCFKKIAEYFIL